MPIKQLITKELKRQKATINLIASENYPSERVLEALGSQLVSKYAEGKSHQRYYQGNEIVDQIEDETKALALKAFKLSDKKWSVNVQPYSGSIANLAAYCGALKLGDTILAMSLEHGGHLTHGHSVSLTSKLFKFKHYGVGAGGRIDYVEVARLAREYKPRLIVCGATAYPRQINFKKFRVIADEVGALLMADVSHIAGLVVGRAHPSPFPYADIVTTTTHKTLRGPRGAMIMSRKLNLDSNVLLSDSIDKAVFPGLQGGPQINTIAAIGVCLEEALKPSFKHYTQQVVKNAQALADELTRLGLNIISGGTDNHLLLVDLMSLGLSGAQASIRLEQAGIIVNKNMVPGDPRKPWDPSGIRLGTAAVTTRGLREKAMRQLAQRIQAILTESVA